MNLFHLLQEQSCSRAAAPALIDRRGRRRVVTFADLDEASARAAALLRRSGLRPGDGVLVFQPMSADLYVALAALFRQGLTAIFVDPSLGRAQIEACCEQTAPKALLATPKAHLLRLVSPVVRRIPLRFATGWGAPGAVRWCSYADQDPEAEVIACADDAPALITFTSGSTGRPKAAVRTHGFLARQHRILAESLRLQPSDIALTTLPIFVLSHLASGVTTLLPDVDLRHPGRVDAEALRRQVEAERVTIIEASPALLERLARRCAEDGRPLQGVAKVFSGGAPVFPNLLERMQAILPHAVVTTVYGSTEAEPIAQVTGAETSADDRRRMLAGGGLLVGSPVAAVELRILPDRWGTPLPPVTAAVFEADALPAGAAGEIVVSGPHVLPGYLRGEGDAETKLRVEGVVWHRTGDAGYLDSGGRLWLLGRCSARIEDERGVLYPFAVECAAQDEPAVKRAAFVQHAGRRLLALELDSPLPVSALHALQERLAWASLDEVRVLPHLPVDRRHEAKIDYPALRQMLR